MRPLKSVFGVIGALVPVVYLGGLFFYFFGIGHSGVGPIPGGVLMKGLGPTLLGLGALAMLFCIPLFLKLVRAFTGARSPRDPRPSWDAQDDAPASDFDPDAVIARYLEQRGAGAASPPISDNGEMPVRPSFGRKVG